MSQLVITIPDAAVSRVLTAVTGMAGYTPVDQADAIAFVKKKIVADLRACTLTWEAQQAQQAAATNPTDPLNAP